MKPLALVLLLLAAAPALAQNGAGEPCGGVGGLACAEGLACVVPAEEGHVDDALGLCEAAPVATETTMCTMEYVPVCGADGRTYGNACAAGVAKVAVAHDGEC